MLSQVYAYNYECDEKKIMFTEFHVQCNTGYMIITYHNITYQSDTWKCPYIHTQIHAYIIIYIYMYIHTYPQTKISVFMIIPYDY